MHKLRIFPVFVKKGQNYSSSVEGKTGQGHSLRLSGGFLPSLPGKSESPPKRAQPHVRNQPVLCNDSLAASQRTTTARCIPSRSSPGVCGSLGCPPSPKPHRGTEAAEGKAICSAKSAVRPHGERSFT